MVTPYIYPDLGGLEGYVFELASYLAARDHQITIITSFKSDETIKYHHNITIHKIPYDFKFSNTPIVFGLYKKILDVLKSNKFDLISAHTPVPYFADMAVICAKKHKIPCIITYHSGGLYKKSWTDLFAFFYANLIEPFILKNIKCIHTYSRYVEKKFKNHSPKYIGMGVELKKYTFNSLLEQKKENQIIFCGNLDKSHQWKGVDYLIKSLPLVKKKIPNILLTIVGSGNHQAEYKKLAREQGVSNNIIFVGKKSKEDLPHYYIKSKLLILPSVCDAESFGRVIIEAAGYGTPSVGSDVGGIPYVIKNGMTGIIVAKKNVNDLSQAIIKLLTNNTLYLSMAQEAYKESNKYRWDNVVLEMEKLFIESKE